MPRPGERRADRGFALVIVLWALVLLTLIGTQITAAGRSEAVLAANLRAAATAQAEADGWVFETILRLLGQAAGPWPPPPGPRVIDAPGLRATIRLGSEDGKLDLNSAAPERLAALLQALGVDARQADTLALNITLWRFPSARSAEQARSYRQAGLGYAPPEEPFQSLTELSLVLGMTPELFTRLAPYVTVYHEGEPDPRAAAPLLRGLLPPPAQQGPLRPGRTAVIEVEVEMAGGRRASRRAIIRLGVPSDRGGWAILAWQ
ncbi:MAG: general secretion pathway protein GspK [Janthinobacterium lividum]